MRFFSGEKKNVAAYQKITDNQKKTISRVNDFSDFPGMGIYKTLGSLELVLRYAS